MNNLKDFLSNGAPSGSAGPASIGSGGGGLPSGGAVPAAGAGLDNLSNFMAGLQEEEQPMVDTIPSWADQPPMMQLAAAIFSHPDTMQRGGFSQSMMRDPRLFAKHIHGLMR